MQVRCRGSHCEGRLTVKDGATEETNELQEQVLLDVGELVEAGLASALLDLVAAEASADVGLEPVGGDVDGAQGAALLPPEGIPRPLALIVVLLLLDGGDAALGVAVGGDVAHEIAVLVELVLLLVDGHADSVGTLLRGRISYFEIARHRCSQNSK